MKTIYQADIFYPEKLRKIYAPPAKLYQLGENKTIFQMPSIAIIGCRECSGYGAKVAYQFAYQLAKKGVCIISGLAKGIDSYAHKGAVAAKGKTIAVLGSGFSHIYPKENELLCQQIIQNRGIILTEYEPNIKPQKMHFPARNRLISGLADGILVVEAKQKSGTLITVDFGLEQGKEIFAIPGDINKNTSDGTNDLIKQGAKLVTNIEDILEEMK
ncbi:MAG: DNA-processing protein DprA [Clostridia bacterium]|nr:DNA-processing protein DprA [Clostridia bacterium]